MIRFVPTYKHRRNMMMNCGCYFPYIESLRWMVAPWRPRALD